MYDAGLESDKYFDILKNKKDTTLLIIPFGTKYDKNKFDLVLQTNRALFEPLTFNGDVFGTKAGDQLKLEIGDFGIFVTKEKGALTRRNKLEEYYNTYQEMRKRWNEIEKEKKQMLSQLQDIKNNITDSDALEFEVARTLDVVLIDLIENISMDPFAN